MRREFRLSDDGVDRSIEGLDRHQFVPALPEIPEHLGICQRPVTIADGDGVAADQCVQAVAMMLGKEFARQFYGAQVAGPEADTETQEFAFEEGVVEAGVMGDEQPAAQFFEHKRGNVCEARRRRHHRRIDSGQPGDERRDRRVRIDQRAPFAHTRTVNLDKADLDDAIVGEVRPGRFQVDEYEGFRG